MNDSKLLPESSRESTRSGDELSSGEIPAFGAVDIVEAFTAMRHEWRGQTKESRALAELIQQAVASLQALDKRSQAVAASAQAAQEPKLEPKQESKQLVSLIVETDHQLTRAVAAITQWEASQRLRAAAAAQAVEEQIAALSGVARWFARPLLAVLAGQRSVREPVAEHPALTGLNMVLERLRRTMRDQGIVRLDVEGQPFDAETMHAIGALASATCPPGHVAEQLSPAYRWQGKLFRFADVRIAELRTPETQKE